MQRREHFTYSCGYSHTLDYFPYQPKLVRARIISYFREHNATYGGFQVEHSPTSNRMYFSMHHAYLYLAKERAYILDENEKPITHFNYIDYMTEDGWVESDLFIEASKYEMKYPFLD